jgi:hypothetical protein
MKYNYLDAARRLSDHELLAHVTSLAGRERAATSGLVAHLAEIDARRLYLGAGFASMFAYCRDALSLSESEAYSRIEAARAVVNALSRDRYKRQLTISGDTLERLRLAKELLRHALPTGDDAALLDCALKALLADVLKQKFAATDRPRGRRGTPNGPRYIPAEVKRAVYLRDFGRCAFVGSSGRRCGERSFLELHHLQPHAEDGPATVDNIELRCRRHNAHEWQQWCTDRSRVEDHAPGGRCRVVGAMSGAAISAAPPATRT